MRPELLLTDLERLAERLGLIIRYERLDDEEANVRSGRCRLKGADMLIIDRRFNAEERVRILIRELKRLNLESVYLKPYLRAYLEEDEADPE